MRDRLVLSLIVGLGVLGFGCMVVWTIELIQLLQWPAEMPLIVAAAVVAAAVVFIVDTVWRRR